MPMSDCRMPSRRPLRSVSGKLVCGSFFGGTGRLSLPLARSVEVRGGSIVDGPRDFSKDIVAQGCYEAGKGLQRRRVKEVSRHHMTSATSISMLRDHNFECDSKMSMICVRRQAGNSIPAFHGWPFPARPAPTSSSMSQTLTPRFVPVSYEVWLSNSTLLLKLQPYSFAFTSKGITCSLPISSTDCVLSGCVWLFRRWRHLRCMPTSQLATPLRMKSKH